MKKIFVTILCLGIFFHAHAVIIQFGEAVFRLLEREAVVGSRAFFEKAVPVAIFSRSKAVVFPSMGEVPFKILRKVSKNKLSLGYGIKKISVNDLIMRSGERYLAPKWEEVALEEIAFKPIKVKKFFEYAVEGGKQNFLLNLEGLEGLQAFSKSERDILQRLGREYCKKEDHGIYGFFANRSKATELESIMDEAQTNLTEANTRIVLAQNKALEAPLGKSFDLEFDGFDAAVTEQKKAIKEFDEAKANYDNYLLDPIFFVSSHRCRSWKIIGTIGTPVILAGLGVLLLCIHS